MGKSVLLLREADKINLRRRLRVIDLLQERVEGGLGGRKIAVLGLSFKPDTDDVRDSPAIDIIRKLDALGLDIAAHDPAAINEARLELPKNIKLYNSISNAIEGREIVLVLTEWEDYRALEPADVKRLMLSKGNATVSPIVFDGRNCLVGEDWEMEGFHYLMLGRKS